jgi:hypothetical protein
LHPSAPPPTSSSIPQLIGRQTYSSEIPVQDQFYRKYVSPSIYDNAPTILQRPVHGFTPPRSRQTRLSAPPAQLIGLVFIFIYALFGLQFFSERAEVRRMAAKSITTPWPLQRKSKLGDCQQSTLAPAFIWANLVRGCQVISSTAFSPQPGAYTKQCIYKTAFLGDR